MANSYLEKRIRNISIIESLILVLLIVVSLIVGKYWTGNALRNLWIGAVLGLFGAGCLLYIEHFFKKRIFFEKGYDLELQVFDKLEGKGLEVKHHIETEYGDLDLLVKNKSTYFGIEAKNWAGAVTFENNKLLVNGWDNTDILITLLKHCGLVRNKEFGPDSGVFIHPALVFGYKTSVNIPENKIRFNNVDVHITTIKELDKIL